MRVLVVDDDEGIPGFIRDILTDEGYEVVEANDGAEALDLARRQPPDLLLLHMRMPVMDGWEFARTYARTPPSHAHHGGRHAPAIAADIHAFRPFPT